MKTSILFLFFENYKIFLSIILLTILALYFMNKNKANISNTDIDKRRNSYDPSQLDLISSRVGAFTILILVIILSIIYYLLV